MALKRERIAKNNRLTISLPVEVVDMLDTIGDEMEASTGLKLSYAQIVVLLVHQHAKKDEK